MKTKDYKADTRSLCLSLLFTSLLIQKNKHKSTESYSREWRQIYLYSHSRLQSRHKISLPCLSLSLALSLSYSLLFLFEWMNASLLSHSRFKTKEKIDFCTAKCSKRHTERNGSRSLSRNIYLSFITRSRSREFMLSQNKSTNIIEELPGPLIKARKAIATEDVASDCQALFLRLLSESFGACPTLFPTGLTLFEV